MANREHLKILKQGVKTYCMNSFERILTSPREEDAQRFLTANNEILLSTFKKGLCIPKFKFGNEFVSDFVLVHSSSLGCYITLVEIEPPTERAFTKNGKYAKRLNDAIGQINDWFAWISENRDYFFRSLSAVKVPQNSSEHHLFGLTSLVGNNVFIDAKIIIGRRSFLSESDNKRRRAVYDTSNKTIEITHFDRLLDTYQKIAELKKVQYRDTTSDELATLSNSKFLEVKRLVARHKNTDQSTLRSLAADSEGKVRMEVAVNQNTDQVTLRLLAEDPESAVVYEVARNENTPHDVLQKLIYRKDGHLHRILLKRIALPEKLMPILFDRTSEYLKREILEHPHCPVELLLSASSSPDRGLRRRAAQHINLRDEATLSRLADDLEAFVRAGAAINPNLPSKLIKKLSYDEDKHVRIAAKYQNANTPEEDLIIGLELEDEGVWALGEIAQHPNLKRIDILRQLAEHENYLVRLGVVKNKHLLSDIRKKLLDDPDKQVRDAARWAVKD